MLAENTARMASEGPPAGYPEHFFERFEGAQKAVRVSKNAFAAMLPGQAGAEARVKAVAGGLKIKLKQTPESSPAGKRSPSTRAVKGNAKLPALK